MSGLAILAPPPIWTWIRFIHGVDWIRFDGMNVSPFLISNHSSTVMLFLSNYDLLSSNYPRFTTIKSQIRILSGTWFICLIKYMIVYGLDVVVNSHIGLDLIRSPNMDPISNF